MATRVQRGLTLIELMTAIAVMAVLAAVATPGLGTFAASQRVKATANDLASDLFLARNEALKRQRTVVLTPQQGDLLKGWQVAEGGTVLANRGSAGRDLTVTGVPADIRFDRNGRVQDAAAGLRMELTAANAGAAARRCVELDLTGRVRVRQGACG
jgi:type IV fimbrial biogenesis protein FimT